MKRIIISFGWLMAAGVAIAGTGTSNEFRLDCRTGVRTAALTEKIQYSTAWATNLTAAQQGEAKAVVKVNPCLKTPPKYLVVDMSGGRSAARWPVSYRDEVPSGGWTDEYKTEKLVLRYIPAGSFIMGGRATDYPGAVNTNLHMVTLTKPFYIGVFECTQRQWELVMGNRPSFFTNETCWATRPVDRVSYLDIRGSVFGREWPKHMMVDDGSFLGVVRAKTGNLLFDLPTDAQWEYACRAGTVTALNSGKNLTGEMECENMNEVARYRFNSNNDTLTQVEKANCTTQYCSAKVGSYMPNEWGIFDLHGNLWEHCLDRALPLAVGSIDPVGGNDTTLTKRVIRGGGYNENAWRCRSAFRYADTYGHGYSQTGRGSTVGFRICLHAADFPVLDFSSVLVDASGASAADWTPTRAGTYQLTHEVQVDGVTVALMESALFKVEGPELRISALGELTNGVAVKVEVEGVGVDSGWQVYYTTDGSEPTAGSTKYEGSFALPASATVKAVAISAGGVSSEVASKELALHPALAVEDTKARQRWPWNGKVDVDCEVAGDSEKFYRVTFAVSDEVGGTNLPIRTVWKANEPSVTNCEYIVSPGKYRFVWDAAADLPKGTRFGGVSVSIDAEPSPLADWKRVVEITVDGYAGSETLTDVPVLVRLSSAIEGFDYNDFAAPDTGADMIFTDMDGVARYPYEIDEWHQDGESLVWVKLPQMANGTKFKMAYGGGRGATALPGGNGRAASPLAAAVWSDYAGVWHMNEDSGTAFDSTEHGLDALPEHGTNNLADVSQMVAYENGACGRARVNATQKLVGGNMLVVPSYDALALGGVFVASAWVDGEEEQKSPRLFSRKNYYTDKHGWEVCLSKFTVRAASSMTAFFDRPSFSGNWIYISVIFDGCAVSAYTNGVFQASETLDCAATENGRMLSIGGLLGNDSCNSFVGQYDEIRLRGGTLSADRIKADYDMIAKRDFCTYGKVEAGPGADPVPPSVHSAVVTFNPNGGTLVGQSLVIYKGDSVVFGTMPTATKDGYSFRGWGRTADATEVVKSTDIVPDSGCELFAVWDELTYTVKFNANGGTGTMADEEFTYGIAQSLTANVFKKDGCTFAGWATSATGGKVYDDKQSVNNLTTTPGGTVTLFAVWKEALYMVIDLSGGSSAKSYPVSYLSEVPNNGTWPDAYKTTKLVLRKVKKGSNTAGGSMSKDMWVGVFELTQRQTTQIYGTFLKKGNYNGYAYAYLTIGEKYPMIHSLESNVELGETINTRLNSRVSSLNFVIPTKDQWIYACRAGTTTPFNNGTSDEAGLKKVAVCLKKSSYYTAYEDVGSRDPNAWGLYDMHGNVSERVGSVTGPYYSYAGTSYLITCMGGFFNGGVDTCKADGERSELAYQSFSHDSASGAADRNSWGYRVFAVTK